MTQTHYTHSRKPFLPLAIIAFLTTTSFATAQEKVVDIIPPASSEQTDAQKGIAEETHPILRLTPDKSELVKLKRDAKSVIIGNESHINVIADSARTLVVVPRSPGATHFTILDNNGQVIMQRHVIVASPKTDYVRIKRTCTENANGCQDTSVFYCPDMCHEIGLTTDGQTTTQDASDNNNSQSAQTDHNDPNEGTQ